MFWLDPIEVRSDRWIFWTSIQGDFFLQRVSLMQGVFCGLNLLSKLNELEKKNYEYLTTYCSFDSPAFAVWTATMQHMATNSQQVVPNIFSVAI